MEDCSALVLMSDFSPFSHGLMTSPVGIGNGQAFRWSAARAAAS
jgi:hypothetical protein